MKNISFTTLSIHSEKFKGITSVNWSAHLRVIETTLVHFPDIASQHFTITINTFHNTKSDGTQ